jgi:hypothetical protein
LEGILGLLTVGVAVDSADGEVVGRAVGFGDALGVLNGLWVGFEETFGVAFTEGFGEGLVTRFFIGFFVVACAEEPSQSEVIDPNIVAMNFLLLELSSEGSRFTR